MLGVGRLLNPSLVLLILWPWLLTVINSNWLYLNSSFFSDTWIYFGHFLNLPNLLAVYKDQPQIYFDDRMAWIAPGYILYHTLPPLLANAVLRFTVYYAVVLSIYGVLTLTVSRRAALVGALLCSSYSYFVLTAGADYVEAPALAYYTLTLLLVTLGARLRGRRLWLVLAGIAGAAPIFNNPFALAFTPGILLYYGWLNRERPWRDHLEAVLLALLGAAGLTVALGLFSLAVGGEFLFVLSSLRFGSRLMQVKQNVYIVPIPAWQLASPHLVWPMLTLLASVAALAAPWFRSQLRAYPLARLFLVLHILASLTLVAFQMRGATPVLVVYYYTGYLIPTTFMAIGVMLAPALDRLARIQFAAFSGTLSVLALAGVVFHRCGSLQVGAYPNYLPAALGLVWIGAMLAWPVRLWGFVPLAVAFYAATPNPFLGTFGLHDFCSVYPQSDRTQEYLAVIEGNRVVAESAPGERVYFWYNLDESQLYRSLASTYLHSQNLISEDFPSFIPPGSSENLLPSPMMPVALVTRDMSGVEQARQVLQARGREMMILGQRSVRQGEIAYVLTVFRAQPKIRTVALGQTIDLSAAGDPSPILRSGWAAPEAFGSWTIGPRAEVVADLDVPPQQAVSMSLDIVSSVGGFVAEEHRPTITIRVSANDTPVGEWILDRTNLTGSRQVVIPADVLARSGPLHITLDIDRPYSLQELGYNDDVRPEAFAASQLRFTAAP